MGFVFVSHAGTDKAERVRPLVMALLVEKLPLWVDRPGHGEHDFHLSHAFIERHALGHLPLGQLWTIGLMQALRDCGVVLACLSKAAIDPRKEVLMQELFAGHFKGDKLVTCIVDDTRVEDLPARVGAIEIRDLQNIRVRPALIAEALEWLDKHPNASPRELPKHLNRAWDDVRHLRDALDARRLDPNLRRHLEKVLKEAARLQFAEPGDGSAPDDKALIEIHLSKWTPPPDKRSEWSWTPHPPLRRGPGALASWRFLLLSPGGAGKTTLLRQLAGHQARLALTDSWAAVPVYVSLQRLSQPGTDLQACIDSCFPIAPSVFRPRQVLWLFDEFNELPPLQRAQAARWLRQFIDRLEANDEVLIGSRNDPMLDRLREQAQLGVLRLEPLTQDDIGRFLASRGLKSLHEAMEPPVRELATNPFQLQALLRIHRRHPQRRLPTSRGALYHQMVSEWIDNEHDKRHLAYDYERIKLPLLAAIAERMTAADAVWQPRDADIEDWLQRQLQTLHALHGHRSVAPAEPRVGAFLEEVLGDGLLQRSGAGWEFFHQTLRDWFAAWHFRAEDCAMDLVALTPTMALPDQVEPGGGTPIHFPTHRFIEPLLMLCGIVDDATPIVQALAKRHALLCAAAVAASGTLHAPVTENLAQTWAGWIRDVDHGPLRVVGMECAGLAKIATAEVIDGLFSVTQSWPGSRTARECLGRLAGQPNVAALWLHRALDHAHSDRSVGSSWYVDSVKLLVGSGLLEAAVKVWSGTSAPMRRRIEALLNMPAVRSHVDVALGGLAADQPDLAAAAGKLLRAPRRQRQPAVEYLDTGPAASPPPGAQSTPDKQPGARKQAAKKQSDLALAEQMDWSQRKAHASWLIERLGPLVQLDRPMRTRRRAAAVLRHVPDGLREVYGQISTTWTEQGPEKALTIIEAHIEALPDDGILTLCRFNALLERDAHAAHQVLADAIARRVDFEPDECAGCWMQLAEAWQQAGEPGRARDAARQAVACNQYRANAATRSLLAWSAYLVGDHAEAASAAEQALAIDPTDPRAAWVAVLSAMCANDELLLASALQHVKRLHRHFAGTLDQEILEAVREQFEALPTQSKDEVAAALLGVIQKS
jgi:tetratricopeptide (TPR) repeat protein